jgi:D-alanyl-D-alanine carboxypeptidase
MLSPEDELEDITRRYAPGWVAHGLAGATAPETARFLEMLFAGSLFDPTLLGDMLTGAPVAEQHPWMVKPSYGLGLMMDPGNRFGIVAGHTGGGPGYSTAAYHFPDLNGHRVTCVALVNRDGGDLATSIVFSIAAALADHL